MDHVKEARKHLGNANATAPSYAHDPIHPLTSGVLAIAHLLFAAVERLEGIEASLDEIAGIE